MSDKWTRPRLDGVAPQNPLELMDATGEEGQGRGGQPQPRPKRPPAATSLDEADLARSRAAASDRIPDARRGRLQKQPAEMRPDDVAPSSKSLLLPDCAAADVARMRRKSPVTVQEWVASLPTPVAASASTSGQMRPAQSPRHGREAVAPSGRLLSRSPAVEVEVQPSSVTTGDDRDDDDEDEAPASAAVCEDVEDTLILGAEAEDDARALVARRHSDSQPHQQQQQQQRHQQQAQPAQPPSQPPKLHNPLHRIPLEARRSLFLRTHDRSSFQSDISAKTASSVDSVLFSREVDPTELLMDLGFGGGSTAEDIAGRIPTRFLQKSAAKGISVEDFLRKQEELTERFDSGSNGYRGLNASSSSARPSELVEKIIEKLRSQEHRLRRQLWTSSASLMSSSMAAAASSASNTASFESMSPERDVPRGSPHPHLSLASVVGQLLPGVTHATHVGPRGPTAAFRSAVQSVLSPANRRFIESQAEDANKPSENRRLVLGGQVFTVDGNDLSVKPLNVISEEDDDERMADCGAVKPRESQSPRVMPPSLGFGSFRPPSLSKRDSTLSVNSSCSMESDWSDEEMDELERILDGIGERSEEAEQRRLQSERDSEAKGAKSTTAAEARWGRLRQEGRSQAAARLRQKRQAAIVARTNAAAAAAHQNADPQKAQRGTEAVADPSDGVNNSATTARSAPLMIATGDHRIPRRFATEQLQHRMRL